jgi:hypothetical protein
MDADHDRVSHLSLGHFLSQLLLQVNQQGLAVG